MSSTEFNGNLYIKELHMVGNDREFYIKKR